MMFFKSREREVYEHIREEIENRLARTGAAREVSDFLLNRWSYLLAGIYFSHGDQHPDWEAGWQTVNALLWSLVPKQDREETEQLLRLLPTLLERIQDGCEAMNLDDAERDALFTQLTMLHAAVARAGLQAQPDEEGPITHLGLDADLEMGDEELASLGEQMPQVVVPEGAAMVSDVPDLDALKVGGAIFLKTAEGGKTLYLQWVSPMGGMYLFADTEGFDAVSLTRARLVERLRNGEVRFL
ncbi:MAG: DUF1631 family protein [Parasulfuritortus sp.]|jgi:hypothetical protein|nr:DUF1631 family protein [Parasulfuritortus sp.]